MTLVTLTFNLVKFQWQGQQLHILRTPTANVGKCLPNSLGAIAANGILQSHMHKNFFQQVPVAVKSKTNSKLCYSNSVPEHVVHYHQFWSNSDNLCKNCDTLSVNQPYDLSDLDLRLFAVSMRWEATTYSQEPNCQVWSISAHQFRRCRPRRFFSERTDGRTNTQFRCMCTAMAMSHKFLKKFITRVLLNRFSKTWYRWNRRKMLFNLRYL